MRVAEAGIAELRQHVDTLLVIPNQNLFRIATDRTTFAEAFVLADQVLYSGIACIVDLIVKEGLINLDLADVKTVLSGMGTAMMGTGEASGEQRAIVASEEAIVNPLLDDTSLKGAKSLLLSITGGRDLTLWEVDEAANRVRQEVDPDANIIVGATFDEGLGDKVRVSIVASGMGRAQGQPHAAQNGAWAPRAQRPPAVPGAPTDYQLRLSEAIDDVNARGGPGGGKTAHADEHGRRTSGDVYIQDGPPQLASVSPATRDKGRARGLEAQLVDPTENGRRVPGVEDFSQHAEREYWAKSSEGDKRAASAQPPFVYQRQPEAPPVKTSLLRRLTGGGRSRREVGSNDQLQKHSRSRNGAGTPEEQVDLPVFFGRGKR
jgi:cell division protein FtsZ